MTKRQPSVDQIGFEIKYNDTPVPKVGDWMLTPYGPGNVLEILEPKLIPERLLEFKQKFSPGQTHGYVDISNPNGGGVDMCDEEGYPLMDLSLIGAVQYRSAGWNHFRLSDLTEWNGKHQYNEGPMK